MKLRKLMTTAVLSALSLVVYVLESQIPPLIPVYGVKLGLANVVTLIALYLLGGKSAFVILFLRCVLGSVFGGGITGLAFSLTGGLLAMSVM